MQRSPEKNEAAKVVYVGRLKDLGLGNPDGIPTTLETDADIEAYGHALSHSIGPVEDETHFGCIDGRCVLMNADGSHARLRRRQVGGTGVVLEMALWTDVDIMNRVEPDADPHTVMAILHDELIMHGGIRPSAHQGGCGGVNGAIDDARSVATKDSIGQAVKTVMDNQAVHSFTGVPFSAGVMATTRSRAAVAADWLEKSGWVGQEYVASVEAQEPAGVEQLDVEPTHRFHGHREPALVVTLLHGKTISESACLDNGVQPPFVMDMEGSMLAAAALTGTDSGSVYEAALQANITKHLAVADRLPSDNTPVYIIIG